MTSYKPTKKELAMARELRSQIRHLTCRWHLGFTEDERETIKKALVCLQEQCLVSRPHRRTPA